jgi:hypothetical protein
MITIKCFCLNDQIQDSFSLLCIEFQFSNYSKVFFIYLFEMQMNVQSLVFAVGVFMLRNFIQGFLKDI